VRSCGMFIKPVLITSSIVTGPSQGGTRFGTTRMREEGSNKFFKTAKITWTCGTGARGRGRHVTSEFGA
jgi:hypothetical protein